MWISGLYLKIAIPKIVIVLWTKKETTFTLFPFTKRKPRVKYTDNSVFATIYHFLFIIDKLV